MNYKQTLFGLILSAMSSSLFAYSPDDKQGTIYQGLQDLNVLADAMGLDRKQSLGTIGKNNLIPSLLSAWDEGTITKLIHSTGNIKETAKKVIKAAFSSPLYELSGLIANEHEFLNLVDNSDFLGSYDPMARGVTLSNTDALFVPVDAALTKDLAGHANTASDQKSSSTRIPANTPVLYFWTAA